MKIKGLMTKNGGVAHVHFGRQCTTNLWGQWLEITDMQVIYELKSAAPDMVNIKAVQQKYAATIQNYSKPYVRLRNQGGPGAPSTPAQSTTAEPVKPEVPVTDTPDQAPNEVVPAQVIRAAQITAVQNLQKFFSEFHFTPAARFINTMALQPTAAAARTYVTNYVKLINNSDSDSIAEKVKSAEFLQIAENIIANPPKTKINNRLVIWYGDAGTGKTTKAIKENPGADVIPCNANILPDELMRTFDFNDANGHPVFKPSSLRIAMETGKTIIFDEINLLTFDCLRLLQTLTDSKDTITYNGELINIKPGFKIIGTMNLVVNDQVYNLPEPLVDRCAEIKEFTISAQTLAAYAFN